uniref:Uncharacterized protein n=1 Tax=Anguilla anguilla TaxID=7936 RepID=A0A0E9SYL7_ANGAN
MVEVPGERHHVLVAGVYNGVLHNVNGAGQVCRKDPLSPAR